MIFPITQPRPGNRLKVSCSSLPIFREMLTKTRFLEDCKILRFESFSSSCRCETFNGHSLNREYENSNLTETQRAYVVGLGQEQLFVVWDTECFSLSPFLHFVRDATGHESYVCFYKGRKQGKYWYEPVKVDTKVRLILFKYV